MDLSSFVAMTFGAVRAHLSADLLETAEEALRQRSLDEAWTLFSEAAELESKTDQLAARVLIGLGQIAFLRDDAKSTLEFLEQAIVLHPEAAEDPSLAETLGRAYARKGDVASAVAVFRNALERARSSGPETDLLRFSLLLANALIDDSQFVEATLVLADGLECESMLDAFARAQIHWTQLRLHAMKEEPQAAVRHARRALHLLKGTEHDVYLAHAMRAAAFAEIDAGNPARALELIARSRSLLGDGLTSHDEAKFAMEEARALAMLGRREEAAGRVMSTHDGFAASHTWDIGRSYVHLAAIFADGGNDERALEVYELAIETLGQTSNRYLVDALCGHGTVLERTGRTREALAAFRRAAEVRHDLDRRAARV